MSCIWGSRSSFNHALNQLSDALALVSYEGKIIEANYAGYELIGIDKSRLEYKHIEDLPEENWTRLKPVVQNVWETEKSQELDFGDFSEFSGQFDLEHIEVKLLTKNSIGAKADVLINTFKSTSDQNEIMLNSDVLSFPISISSATENPNSNPEVTPSTSTLVFNEVNSNIDELIENKPHTLGVDFELLLNPDDNQDDGFLFKNYGVKSELQIEIPLSFSGSAPNLFYFDKRKRYYFQRQYYFLLLKRI